MPVSSDVEALLDQKPIHRIQRIALAMVTTAIVLEGFDIQLIAFVAPVIAAVDRQIPRKRSGITDESATKKHDLRPIA